MKVISLINMKGGVGKTTLSVNIAHGLATRKGKRVLLIDIDPQFNATQCLMKGDDYVKHLGDEKDTILNLFERTRVQASSVNGITQQQTRKLQDITPICITENFDLLPGNLELFRLEMSSGEGRERRLKIFLEHNAENYDYVIIDTPPTPSIWMTSSLIASDYYLIPVKPDPLSFTGIDLLNNIVEDKKENFGLNLKCLGIVLTMTVANTYVYKEARARLHKSWPKLEFEKHLPQRTKIARNQTNKGFILSSDVSDDTKLSMLSIINELLKRLGDE